MKLSTVCIVSLLSISVILGGCGASNDSSSHNAQTPALSSEFAQCLTSKGVKMYGTDRCPHCKNQKKLFGDGFKQIEYIECEQNKIKCNLAKVSTYPTWINAQGQRVIGEQTPEQLAALSGCPLNTTTGTASN